MWDMTPYQGLATSRWVLDATTSSGLTIDTTVPGWAISTTGITGLFPAINASKALAVFLELKDFTASGRSGGVSLNLGNAKLVWDAVGMRVLSSAGTATSRDVPTTHMEAADWGMRLQGGVLQGHFGGTMVEVPAGDASSSVLVPTLTAGSNTVRVRQMVLTVVWPVSGGTVTQALAQPTGGDATSGALQLAQTAQTTADGLVPRVESLETRFRDTGWRSLPMIEGVTGTLLVRRTGDQVWLRLINVIPPAGIYATNVAALPYSIVPDGEWFFVAHDEGAKSPASIYGLYNVTYLSWARTVNDTHSRPTTPQSGSITYSTKAAFPEPSAYPGTPA